MNNAQLLEIDGVRFLEWLAPIGRIDDALDIVSVCAEEQVNLVLVERGRFASEFFDLKTRFAGEFVQKLQNYRIRVAAVIPPDDGRENFERFRSEARRGNPFRVFDDREGAETWLLSP